MIPGANAHLLILAVYILPEYIEWGWVARSKSLDTTPTLFSAVTVLKLGLFHFSAHGTALSVLEIYFSAVTGRSFFSGKSSHRQVGSPFELRTRKPPQQHCTALRIYSTVHAHAMYGSAKLCLLPERTPERKITGDAVGDTNPPPAILCRAYVHIRPA